MIDRDVASIAEPEALQRDGNQSRRRTRAELDDHPRTMPADRVDELSGHGPIDAPSTEEDGSAERQGVDSRQRLERALTAQDLASVLIEGSSRLAQLVEKGLPLLGNRAGAALELVGLAIDLVREASDATQEEEGRAQVPEKEDDE